MRRDLKSRGGGEKTDSDQVISLLPAWAPKLTLAATLLFALALLVLLLFDFSRTERAAGWVVPQGGLVRITAREAGRVERYYVDEGQRLEPNTDLIRISGALRSDQSEAGETTEALYQVRTAAEIARQRGQRDALDSRRRQIASEIQALHLEVDNAAGQIDLIRQRLLLREDALNRIRVLMERGFAAQTVVLARETDVLNERQALAAAQNNLHRTTAQLRERELAATALDAEVAELIAAQDGALALLEQEQLIWRGGNAQVYRSDVAATVVSLPQPLSQTVAPGSVLAVLAPLDRPLEVELFLPSRAATHVSLGQAVRILYEAFPHEKYGAGSGVVIYVAPSVLSPADVNAHGMDLREAVIRVRVQLDQTSISSGGETYRLSPGMRLTGVVELERRSLWDTIFSPILEGLRQ